MAFVQDDLTKINSQLIKNIRTLLEEQNKLELELELVVLLIQKTEKENQVLGKRITELEEEIRKVQAFEKEQDDEILIKYHVNGRSKY